MATSKRVSSKRAHGAVTVGAGKAIVKGAVSRKAGAVVGKVAKAVDKASRKTTPTGNGMQHFAMHAAEKIGKRMQSALRVRSAAMPAAAPSLKSLDPETAAYRHLQQALKSDQLPEFTDPQGDGDGSEFQRLGTETVPLTDTRTVKYRQTFNKIPVYGSLVTVELDNENECLAINSALGAPKNVSAIASVAPQQALELAAKSSGHKPAELKSTPRLHYFFDRVRQSWALVYIVENVRNRAPRKAGGTYHQPAVFDYVVNAHTGKLVASLPRTPTVASAEQGPDDLGAKRRFTAERKSAERTLRNVALNVSTFGFKFADPSVQSHKLPGTAVKRAPPAPWPTSAVSAHANAETVALFLRNVLKRNGIDNAGGPMISTIDCVVADESTGPQEWVNAYWDPDLKQMIYGQRVLSTGQPLSIAAMLDIVAHEMFHGVTDNTARLEYAAQSGAMNESYSDIFGIIVQNVSEPDRTKWQWRVGIGFEADGVALRDMKSPKNGEQPAHMDEYVHSGPPKESNDWGGVHINSGIHNYAAYRIMSARSSSKPVLTVQELAALFYLALTQHLSRTSEFADSRRAVLLVAQTLFRNDTAAVRRRKTRAIERGFSAAGIE